MQVPQIRLHQINAQIGLNIIQPKQEIRQMPAELSIQQIPAEMQIERKPAFLEINQEQAWDELGFKSGNKLSAEMAEFSKREGLEAVAQISQEGDQLAAIENRTDMIASISSQKANPEPLDYNIAFIPSIGSVKLHYTPTEIHIAWKQGGAKIESTPQKPIHDYTPGRTEVYVRQRQQLNIDFIGINVNRTS